MYRLLRHLTNPKSLITAVKNPIKAYNFVRYNHLENKRPHDLAEKLQNNFFEQDWEQSVINALQISEQNLTKYLREYDDIVNPHLENCKQEFRDRPFSLGGIEMEGRILYCIVRSKRPNYVVEVGVANGVSSFILLSAMYQNRADSQLVSIDLPKFESDHNGNWGINAGAWIPKNRNIGWIVPENLKTNWRILIGDVFKELPELLANPNSIDLYVYDGPKVYNQRFEALEYFLEMSDNSWLFCDDIAWNSSAEDFAMANEFDYILMGNTILIKK